LAHDSLIFLQHTERIYDVLKWQDVKNPSHETGENIRYSLQTMNSRRGEAKLSLSLAATKDTVKNRPVGKQLKVVDNSSILLNDTV